MTENSTAGLTMLDAERSVVVTGEERHQDVLGELAPERGRARRVTIELVPIGPRLEARLDGRRVGELTALMSQRYGPTVDSVLRGGGRPGCIGRVALGKRGIEVELRLPAVGPVGLATEQLPVVPPVGSPSPGRRSRTPLWLGASVVGLLVVIAWVIGGTRARTPTAGPTMATGTPTVAATSVAAPPTPEPTSETTAPPTRSARKSTAAPTRSNPAVYYRSCEAAQAAGVAPLRTGDPGYRIGLDPDGDGVACEVA
jgi:hypothetical protein